jgi:hemolysin activation/secretion protein
VFEQLGQYGNRERFDVNSKSLPLQRYAISALSLGVAVSSSSAIAQTITVPDAVKGPADIGRIKPEEKKRPTDQTREQQITIPSGAPVMPIPEEAKNIRFVLKDLRIVGATAFSNAQLADISTPYLNREITLDVVYEMANAITARYRKAGYFLSLAFLPDQQVGDGVITLQVLEGYVGTVELPKTAKTHKVIQDYMDRLTAQKPLSAQGLESFLLRLNDLPGYSVSGTLSALDGATDGAVKLTLEVTDKKGKGQISFDNLSSRFLGPNEMSATHTKSLFPLQQTTISGLTSLPTDKLNYATLDHSIVIAPDITLDVTASYAKAIPGFTLAPLEIESTSTFLSASLNYQWVRQRQENLSLKLGIDSRNSDSDLLGAPFTRDRIRALRLSANYDSADNRGGYNVVSLKLSQGIDGLGSSKKGEINLSRAQATPDFTKAELSVTRLQGGTNDWSLLMSASAQAASGPLFSAEEFGYGGQTFGRAYDASELTGDHGVAGSMEVRYGGWTDWQPLSVALYAFYDVGIVWNDDVGQVKRESGGSVGFGLRAATDSGLKGNIGLAWPLTRDISTPIYGEKTTGPRIIIQLNQDF